MLKLTKKLCGGTGSLMISECGGWLTNGHWAVRRDYCDETKLTQDVYSERKLSMETILQASFTSYKAFEDTKYRKEDPKLVAIFSRLTKHEYIAFDTKYLPICNLGFLWAEEPNDMAVIKRSEDRPVDVSEIIALLMPVRETFDLLIQEDEQG